MNRKPPSRLQQYQAFVAGLMDGSSIRFGKKLSRLEGFALFWMVVGRSFSHNRCPARAAALSYTTLLALIPLMAVAMGVTSYFLKSEGKEQIETFIQQFVDRVIPATLNPLDGPEVQESSGDAVSFATGETNLPFMPTEPDMPTATVGDARVVRAQKQAAGYVHEFIQNTYSGTLGVTGVLALLLTVIMTITNVENTLNDIWGVNRGRNCWLALPTTGRR